MHKFSNQIPHNNKPIGRKKRENTQFLKQISAKYQTSQKKQNKINNFRIKKLCIIKNKQMGILKITIKPELCIIKKIRKI